MNQLEKRRRWEHTYKNFENELQRGADLYKFLGKETQMGTLAIDGVAHCRSFKIWSVCIRTCSMVDFVNLRPIYSTGWTNRQIEDGSLMYLVTKEEHCRGDPPFISRTVSSHANEGFYISVVADGGVVYGKSRHSIERYPR